MDCCKCKCMVQLIKRVVADTVIPASGIAGIQAQLTDSPTTLLSHGESIIFDNIILSNNPNIKYAAGQFTISKAGAYSISWQVTTDGTEEFTNINFSIAVNCVPSSTVSSPIVTGQISGTALIAAKTGDIVTLINTSSDGVMLAGTNVQANIVIVG